MGENSYCNTVKALLSDTQNAADITLKFKQRGPSIVKLCSKGADVMENSVDPDQTAPLGAV